jgi:nitrate reductase NapE component
MATQARLKLRTLKKPFIIITIFIFIIVIAVTIIGAYRTRAVGGSRLVV